MAKDGIDVVKGIALALAALITAALGGVGLSRTRDGKKKIEEKELAREDEPVERSR